MNMLKLKISSAILFGCICLPVVDGALVVNDTFSYGATDNTLVPSPWQDTTSNVVYEADLSGSWSGDSDYTLAGAGGSLFSRGLSNYRGGQLDLSENLTGTFWTSVLIQEDADSSDSAGALLAFESGGGTYAFDNFEGFAFGINGDGNLMTAPNSSSGTSQVSGPVTLPTGWGLYIAKITVNGGGADDAIDLWAFDGSDSFGQTEASLGSATFSSSSVQYGDNIGAVWLGGQASGGVNGTSYFDNLRISNLAGDNGLVEVLTGAAIPEPSSVILLSIGLIFVAGAGVKRKR